MNEIISPTTGEPFKTEAPVTIQEKKLDYNSVLPPEKFNNESLLDGCYILKDGRLVLRIALVGKPEDSKIETLSKEERIIGWTYIDVVLAERLIKKTRTTIKLNKRNKSKRV